MRIGIPRAMQYYNYKVLWETFFDELGFDVVLSDDTNKKIIEDGINHSVDESCLASKIYMGHVYNLLDKCEYILIPRFCSYKNQDVSCVKFNALYDICRNIYDDINILTYDVDHNKRRTEKKGFLKMGTELGKTYSESMRAYKAAVDAYNEDRKNLFFSQNCILNSLSKNKIKVLLVSHSYIINDRFLGGDVKSYLKKLDIHTLNANIIDIENKNGWEDISKTLYWKESKELLSGLNYYKTKVDGIIFVSVFPCGPDSLVTDLCLRRIKDVPCINIVLDELNSDTGLQTRLESFVDVISEKKKVMT